RFASPQLAWVARREGESGEEFLERFANGLNRVGFVRRSTRDTGEPLGRGRFGDACAGSLAYAFGNHPGAGSEIGGRVDQDEAAGPAIVKIPVEHDRSRPRYRPRP